MYFRWNSKFEFTHHISQIALKMTQIETSRIWQNEKELFYSHNTLCWYKCKQQHFFFFITYEWAQVIIFRIRLDRPPRDRHSSFLLIQEGAIFTTLNNFITYKWAQLAMLIHCIRMERLGRDRRSNLFVHSRGGCIHNTSISL